MQRYYETQVQFNNPNEFFDLGCSEWLNYFEMHGLDANVFNQTVQDK